MFWARVWSLVLRWVGASGAGRVIDFEMFESGGCSCIGSGREQFRTLNPKP